jgi:hypothetical protein
MLFEQQFWAGIADGSITCTFRRWRRRQVVAGHRYRTGGGIVEVDSVEVIDPGSITDADARRAGDPDAATVRARWRDVEDADVYRIVFHTVGGPDPRAVLAEHDDLTDDDLAAIERRLARLDRASSHGPWTAAVLESIATHPATRAAELAASFDRELQPFKTDVRKLKNLGLTVSLERGYRLSPRGEAYYNRRVRPR